MLSSKLTGFAVFVRVLFLAGLCIITSAGFSLKADEFNDYERRKIDSLEQVIPDLKGEELVRALSSLTTLNAIGNPELSFSYFEQAARLAEKLSLNQRIKILFIHLTMELPYSEHDVLLAKALDYCEKERLSKCGVFARIALGSHLGKSNKHSEAMVFFTEALDKALKMNYTYGIAYSLRRIGQSHFIQSDYLEALKYLLESRTYFFKDGLDDEVATVNYLLGVVEMLLGNYSFSIQHIIDALAFYEQANMTSDIWNCNEMLGNIHIKLGEYEKALRYHRIALDYRSKNKSRIISHGRRVRPETDLGFAYSYNNIASVLLNLKKLDSALYYATRSLQIKNAENSTASVNDIANSHMNLGNIYFAMGNYDSAVIMHSLAADAYKETGNKSSYAEALFGHGKVYLSTREYQKAADLFRSGLNLALEVNDKSNAMEGYSLLSEVYLLNEDYKNALESITLFNQVKDSIFNREKTSIIEELQIRYETEKKENEIIVQEAVILKTKKQLKFAVIGGLLILTLSVLIIILIYKTRRQRERILSHEAASLRKDLELKNKELVCNVSSIYTKNMVINKVARTLSKNMFVFKQANMDLIREIIGDLRQNMDEVSWKEFETRFARVHESFYQHLDEKHPNLSPTERKICAMLKLGLCRVC